MKTFARVISSVFMVLGVIIIVAGIAMMVSGLFAARPKPSAIPTLVPDFSNLASLGSVLLGGAIGFEGCFLAAIGAVLWLLAAITQETEQTSQHLATLLRRLAQPKP